MLDNAETNQRNFKSELEELVCCKFCKQANGKWQEHFGRSKEYWIEWAVAYYQWYSGREYSHFFKVLSFEDLQKMYYTLHEADITKFADIVDSRMKEFFSETNLKRIRTAYGVTQAGLAERSDVSLRSIQMYEQTKHKSGKDQLSEIIYPIF